MREIAWITLLFAGLLETGWALGLRYTEGFTKVGPSVATLIVMGGSVYLLSRSLTSLPLGTAYAVWTGIGAVGTVIAGIILFGESRSVIRLLCIVLIVAGIVGLRFFRIRKCRRGRRLAMPGPLFLPGGGSHLRQRCVGGTVQIPCRQPYLLPAGHRPRCRAEQSGRKG